MKWIRLIRNLLFISGIGGNKAMLKTGNPAPEFTVRSHQGAVVRLSQYRGRSVILWFYPKADTPG